MQDCVLTTAIGGTYIRLYSPGTPPPACTAVKRGEISGFSRQSRRRLLDLCASINREQVQRLPLCVTLTYPRHWPEDPARWKRDLFTLLKRWERRYAQISTIWKLEYQRRGAPHFHLLVFNVPYISQVYTAVDWYVIVGSGDIRHVFAGVQVRAALSWNHATFYAAKYLCKLSDGWPELKAGRYWGVHGRCRLPVTMLVQTMDWKSFCRVRRVFYWYDLRTKFNTGRKLKYIGVKRYLGPALHADIIRYADSLGASLRIEAAGRGGQICAEDKPNLYMQVAHSVYALARRKYKAESKRNR